MHMRARLAVALVVTVAAIVAALAGAAPATAQSAAPTQSFPFPGAALDDLLAASDIDTHILNAGNVCASNVSVVGANFPGGLLGDLPGDEICFVRGSEGVDA